MSRVLFDAALDAVRDFHANMPTVAGFQAWPNDIAWADRDGHALPVVQLVQSDPGGPAADDAEAGQTRRLQQAIMALAPYVEWRLTYTEEEVGADFLQRFGWFELVGPDGHFHSTQTRMTVGYWGRGLYYPWHDHEPEELYCVVSGEGVFEVDGEPTQKLGAGQTRLHRTFQRHALTTEEQPILCFVVWRGDGLADDPRMSS